MASQKWIRDYLYFSKRDRIGILSLLFLITIIYCLPFLIPGPKMVPPLEVVLLEPAVDRLTASTSPFPAQPHRPDRSGTALSGALFDFDPNTATPADWQRM